MANEAGRKFCGECGEPLTLACPACSTPNQPGVKFCGECGAALATQAQPQAAASPPQAERRLVSVLFADLVGFTTLSESRDAEEVREILTRYFDESRRVIERYGGTVEKFIGDAVMAVWGAPTANEDDAERAVRASLDLVAAVTALGQEVGAPDLRARAGVLTGEAAVTVGAEGQGMVAGDLVNTASRVQSTAEPGTVLVGESTKRATEAAITYEDAGTHDLKGKAEPIELWRALRVVAGARGSMRSSGLEAPFVGRDRELRLVKELFHASAEERRAQLVSITGIAGIGKSRLAWEFEKYIDGLAATTYWHRGRCLSYGEGVAYWALAEMVRMRCEILEDEEPGSAREKLSRTLDEHLADPDERLWVEPRLAHLLGLEDGAPGDEENLFSAWRILFERLAEQSPTVLVFEDVQWADAGLLDFLEYLLDWSRGHPLFVVALARPEFADKRPTWGAGKRSFTQLYLEPLSAQAMGDLLAGLVPGLPEDLRARILERAEGVPLYAVETVRMLLDRRLLAQDGNIFRPSGPIDTLEVPETLHALVAARLDGLSAEERRLVQDGSVLGKTFTKQGLASLTGAPEPVLEPLLASLLRKEVLSVQADPRSPERGQYAFLQDIVKRVAYETLSKKERKAKHLAAAQFLASSAGADEDEVVEVVAAHYLDALEAAPDASDAATIRESAREMLVRAGERAASLAANGEAQRAFERAAGLSDDPVVAAELDERAGVMALVGARYEESRECYQRSLALFVAADAQHFAARVSARLAEVDWNEGRHDEALERMDSAFELLILEEPDDSLAALAAQLGRFMFFAGDLRASQRIETALDIAEALSLPEVLAQALTTKSIMLFARGRRQEGLALMRFALETALEHDKPSAALRALYNVADMLAQTDQYAESSAQVRGGLAQARRTGNRYWEWSLLGQLYSFFAEGEWDEARAMIEAMPEEEWSRARQAFGGVPQIGTMIAVHRGDLQEAARLVDLFSALATSADGSERSGYECGQAVLALADGRPDEALRFAETAMSASATFGISGEQIKEAFVVACEAALALEDRAKLGDLVAAIDSLPTGGSSHFLRAHSSRFRAHLAAGADAESADRLFKRAAGLFREMAVPFYLAVTQLEHAELLTVNGRAEEAEPQLAEAHEIFERLLAAPWLERVDAVRTEAGVST